MSISLLHETKNMNGAPIVAIGCLLLASFGCTPAAAPVSQDVAPRSASSTGSAIGPAIEPVAPAKNQTATQSKSPTPFEINPTPVSNSAGEEKPSDKLAAPANKTVQRLPFDPRGLEPEPPFGGREHLFLPVEIGAPRTENNSAPITAPAISGSVELRGFVNVGGSKAILAIDNQVLMLGQGEERDGVRVLALDPPTVTIQQGRAKWLLSLINPRGQRITSEAKAETQN